MNKNKLVSLNILNIDLKITPKLLLIVINSNAI